MSAELSHVDSDGKPAMVDVGHKTLTCRSAIAESVVKLPAAVVAKLAQGELSTSKGPVFATAIIAGVMAAKKTHELIPFCHPIGLDNCDIKITMRGDNAVIRCQCEVTHKTGVEMEALTGASVAALTIYDMCKALSHEIEISTTRLLAKSGGKKDFARE